MAATEKKEAADREARIEAAEFERKLWSAIARAYELSLQGNDHGDLLRRLLTAARELKLIRLEALARTIENRVEKDVRRELDQLIDHLRHDRYALIKGWWLERIERVYSRCDLTPPEQLALL